MSNASNCALAIRAFTATSALGTGCAAHVEALATGRSALRANDFSRTPLRCAIGRIDDLEAAALPAPLAAWDSRNNRLAWLGMHQDGMRDAVEASAAQHGRARVAVLMGTSTGSIGATEEGYRQLEGERLPTHARRPPIHSLHGLGSFVADALDLHGPCLTVSTACSSSAKVFAMAERMIRLGVVDAALVGGADTLCESVLFGFNALELVAAEACRPFDVARCGISIGEAAGFALLERAASAPRAPRLLGYGESSDAWHMSTPHPDGLGAEMSLRLALARAGRDRSEVDYVNLHGTATVKNDAAEAVVVSSCVAPSTRISSTKGMTGHTLGAAGILESVLTLLAMQHDCIPANVGCDNPEPACAAKLALRPESRRIDLALSNSFGFGGNNACLVFARATGASE